jgi:predicted phosphodiesterase
MRKKSIIFLLIFSTLLYSGFKLVSYYLSYGVAEKGVSRSQLNINRGKLVIKIALLADSHIDYQRLKKAVEKAKQQKVDLLVHFGDLSDFGGSNELNSTKQILDNSNLTYYVISGDRDEVERGINFKKLFSEKVCTTQLLKYKVACLSNPFNYTLIDSDYLTNFYNNLKDANIVFTSQPIYNPNSNVYMGFFTKSVKEQADEVYQHLSDSNVKYMFSGDAHFFSKYKDSKIDYYNLGAVTDKKNLQTPNFTILDVYENWVEVRQVNLE